MRVARACFALVLLLCGCAGLVVGLVAELGAVGAQGAAPSAGRSPIVYTAVVDGIIHPVATAYIRHAIAQADAAKAELLVIMLRTPGGLVDSTRDINTGHHSVEDAGHRLRRRLREAAPHRPAS